MKDPFLAHNVQGSYSKTGKHNISDRTV